MVTALLSSPLLLLGVVAFLVLSGVMLIRGESKRPPAATASICANPRCRCVNESAALHCRRCGYAMK